MVPQVSMNGKLADWKHEDTPAKADGFVVRVMVAQSASQGSSEVQLAFG